MPEISKTSTPFGSISSSTRFMPSVSDETWPAITSASLSSSARLRCSSE
ncbi:hypothetical protein emb_1d0584 [Coriobacteriaceae bacterium EMTCatB1]|nr:hypothetical protein emb_1d0584 [Coriobacteriaceae bacterium EMTCatB1]